ncbi:DUF4957 domain-containing protein [Flavobacterium sufflavum]|nr:DUF5123 domain-containing protein [Flavobacterium sufflavum]
MKNVNLNIYKALILIVGVLFFVSCSENEGLVQTRLFRPVLSKELSSVDNTIIVNMGKMKEAIAYKVEISRDTFKTIVRTFEGPENNVIFSGLVWNALYQVRATAYAADAQYDSKISDLGEIKTQRFPSIMAIPASSDVIDTGAKVHWTTAGAAVTGVKVFAFADELLQTPLASYTVSDAERLAGEKIIYGLTPGTKYQIAIYSNAEARGWEVYATKPPLVLGSNDIDLRGINDPAILSTTLTTAVDGSTILLDGNNTYNINSTYSFNKSLKIKSGYSFNPAGATLNLVANFNLVANSTVASIVFEGLTLTSTDVAASSKYVFNVAQNGNIGEIAFNNCKINNFRGIARFQASTGTIGKYTINNSIVNNIGGYGVFNIDVATWTAGDVLLKNSTIYRTNVFLASKSTTATKSVSIEDCTLNDFVAKTRAIFAWTNEVTNGITIKNTIMGRGWDTTAGGTDYAIAGYSGLATSNFIVVNSYSTADFKYVTGAKTIPNFPSFTYAKKVEDLWKDIPNGDFSFKDSGFGGLKDSGDPRWRL